MPGPARKPNEVKRLQGNPGKRALKESTIKRVPGVPVRVATIKGHALAFWHRVEAILKKQNRWTADIQFALVALCECYGEREALREYLEKLGWDRFEDRQTAHGDSYHTAHPALLAYQNADVRFLRWLNEFGLTDASRSKIDTPPGDGNAPGEDPAAEFGIN